MIIYEVIPNELYVSNFPKPKDKPLLDELGINSIVCLVNEATPDEVRRDCNWLCVPLPDGKRVPDMTLVLNWSRQQIIQGHTVLLHCRAGRNRAALVAGVLLMWRYGCSGKWAYDYLTTLRKGVLHNQVYADYLQHLAAPGLGKGVMFK